MTKGIFTCVAFILIISSNIFGMKADTLFGKVEDHLQKPVSGVRIVIKGKPPVTSNEKGIFKIQAGKISMPIDLSIEKEGLLLNEYVFLEEDNFLEVYLKNDPNYQKKQVVATSPAPLPKSPDLPIVKTNNTPVKMVPKVEDPVSQYKEEINKIVADLVAERIRLQESNRKIQEEITKISDRLKKESNLTEEQRKELESSIMNLEKTMQENNQAFTKAHEQTNKLIDRLREVIAVKDAQIAQAIKEKTETEKRLNRNLVIFSIISFSLLLLAVVFYTIAYKMKRQKNALIISNSELVETKAELLKRIQEAEVQINLIEEQYSKLDTFVYKLSHDLKGPLKSLEVLTTFALKEEDKTKLVEILNHIGKSASKLNKQVVDLLEIARSKNTNVELTEFAVKPIIDDIIECFEALPESEGLSISLEMDENLEIETDPRLFKSILQNLIENGVKYQDLRKENRILNIKLQIDNDKLLTTVQDNGIGIPAEHLEKVFDIFFKNNPESPGSGIGLHITKMNVQKLGGEIGLSSKYKEGTTFSLTLPVKVPESVV